uniref:Protein kinase domain-containing protein n=1 Tax=viral metagenome TaxID=1070528 RepID=A0A6C0JBJ0_9ZZZZ
MEKLYESIKLKLNCDDLVFLNFEYKANGFFGYIFKIKNLPFAIKIIPTHNLQNDEFKITQTLYNALDSIDVVNTILKPFGSFTCSSKDKLDTFKTIIKLLRKNKINVSKFFDRKINYKNLINYIIVNVYEWVELGTLADFTKQRNDSVIEKLLLAIFCSYTCLKLLTRNEHGSFLHRDLHPWNILIKRNIEKIPFLYEFVFDNKKVKISFESDYIPIISDLSGSIVLHYAPIFVPSNLDFFRYFEYNDFYFLSYFLKKFVTKNKKLLNFLNFVVGKSEGYNTLYYGKSPLSLRVEKNGNPFKINIEDIILHPIFSKHVTID